MDLLGIDVGLSKRRRSMGIAAVQDGRLWLNHVYPFQADRFLRLSGWTATVTALDAPLVPADNPGPRAVERLFSLGVFQRRSKPGMTHFGTLGPALRQAGRKMAQDAIEFTSAEDISADFPRIFDHTS